MVGEGARGPPGRRGAPCGFGPPAGTAREEEKESDVEELVVDDVEGRKEKARGP